MFPNRLMNLESRFQKHPCFQTCFSNWDNGMSARFNSVPRQASQDGDHVVAGRQLQRQREPKSRLPGSVQELLDVQATDLILALKPDTRKAVKLCE